MQRGRVASRLDKSIQALASSAVHGRFGWSRGYYKRRSALSLAHAQLPELTTVYRLALPQTTCIEKHGTLGLH